MENPDTRPGTAGAVRWYATTAEVMVTLLGNVHLRRTASRCVIIAVELGILPETVPVIPQPQAVISVGNQVTLSEIAETSAVLTAATVAVVEAILPGTVPLMVVTVTSVGARVI